MATMTILRLLRCIIVRVRKANQQRFHFHSNRKKTSFLLVGRQWRKMDVDEEAPQEKEHTY